MDYTLLATIGIPIATAAAWVSYNHPKAYDSIYRRFILWGHLLFGAIITSYQFGVSKYNSLMKINTDDSNCTNVSTKISDYLSIDMSMYVLWYFISVAFFTILLFSEYLKKYDKNDIPK